MKFEPKEKLQGKRIFLRKAEKSFAFANQMYAVVDASRNHILPWLDWALHEVTSKPEDCYSFLSSAFDGWSKGDVFEYSIFNNENNEFLGGLGVHLRGKPHDKQFEIGFWLKKDASGKGYMQEAVKLIEEEFFALGVERLIIKNATDNIPSKNVAEKLGYQFEGVARNGIYIKSLSRFCDVNTFAKLKDDK